MAHIRRGWLVLFIPTLDVGIPTQLSSTHFQEGTSVFLREGEEKEIPQNCENTLKEASNSLHSRSLTHTAVPYTTSSSVLSHLLFAGCAVLLAAVETLFFQSLQRKLLQLTTRAAHQIGSETSRATVFDISSPARRRRERQKDADARNPAHHNRFW